MEDFIINFLLSFPVLVTCKILHYSLPLVFRMRVKLLSSVSSVRILRTAWNPWNLVTTEWNGE